MKWATRKGVKFDRSACAWLILRHLDPAAEFSFLTEDEMPAALAAGARPFHNIGYAGPGARKQTSFQTLLDEYQLNKAGNPLQFMAEFIHAGEIESEAKGIDDPLRAIIKGVNALVKSDQEMIDRTLPIYDALYAYCQRKAAGSTRWAGLEPGWGQS